MAFSSVVPEMIHFLNQEQCRHKVKSSYRITSIKNIPNYKGGINGTHLHDADLNRVFNPHSSDAHNYEGKLREIVAGDVIGHYGASGWYYVLKDVITVIELSDLRIEMDNEVEYIKTLQDDDPDTICEKLCKWRNNTRTSRDHI